MLRACLFLLLVAACASAQYPRRPADRVVTMDGEGVLRWLDGGSEVALFGVNYYPPCSIDYANLTLLGVDHKETIDRDLLHFEPMGLDALRLHVFDREISDEQGNLLDNHHVELLDYLIAEAKARGIYTVLTPIAWWHASEGTRGFSDLYDKAQMHTDPQAVAAQRNYLQQFVSHTNRYTGLTYGEDPAIPCFEIINEPIPAADTSDDVIVEYVDALYDAIRSTGTQKPVFYNGWGGRHSAIARAKVEGCTFGWYPSGLVSGGVLTRNFLPVVNDYADMRDEVLATKAKIVYEFDAADIPGGYMYPAMARAFRSGGAQIATQFQYDPLPLAESNVNWQTHFLNLVYAPSRTVSFVIAAEAFRRLPRLGQFGAYPTSCRFGDFRVSYEDLLSELVTEEVFMYSNDTATQPPAPGKLTRVVGCGSSSVAQYEGTGAYFLDRVAEGVWRLEVYPDCVWVADPFGATRLDREASRLYWRERGLTLRLPDLGRRFAAVPLRPGGGRVEAEDGRVVVGPGAYVLRREGAAAQVKLDPTFYAPLQRDSQPAAWHIPAQAALAGKSLAVSVTVATETDPEQVALQLRNPGGGTGQAIPLEQAAPYRYEGEIPADLVRKGTLTYCVAVETAGRTLTFPNPDQGSAGERFAAREPVTLLRFTGQETLPELGFGGAPGQEAAVGFAEGSGALRLTATGFGPPPSAAGLRLPSLVEGEDLRGLNTLVVRARRTEPRTSHLELALVQESGNTAGYGVDVPLAPEFRDFRVPLSKLKPLWQTRGGYCSPTSVREVQFAIGSWLFPAAADQPHAVEVQSVSLEYDPEAWRVPVHAPDDPCVIFAPSAPVPGIVTELPYRQWITSGSGPDTTAWRIEVERFAQQPSALGVRADIADTIAVRRSVASGYDVLRLRARATEAQTTAVELVLVEDDDAPWGTTTKLTTEWQDIEVPLSDLRYFAHWWHPEGRGGEGDRCRPENLAAVHLTFGAWLYPETYGERHGYEVEFIRLERQ